MLYVGGPRHVNNIVTLVINLVKGFNACNDHYTKELSFNYIFIYLTDIIAKKTVDLQINAKDENLDE